MYDRFSTGSVEDRILDVGVAADLTYEAARLCQIPENFILN
jgi:hypothetical protein